MIYYSLVIFLVVGDIFGIIFVDLTFNFLCSLETEETLTFSFEPSAKTFPEEVLLTPLFVLGVLITYLGGGFSIGESFNT